MNIEEAKKRAEEYIKELSAGNKDYENMLLRGVLILEDAIKGDI